MAADGLSADDLIDLERSVAMATEGPWDDLRTGEVGDGQARSGEAQVCNHRGRAVTIVVGDGSAEWCANVVLAASAPQLLATVKRLRAALARFGQHGFDCGVRIARTCDCGLVREVELQR